MPKAKRVRKTRVILKIEKNDSDDEQNEDIEHRHRNLLKQVEQQATSQPDSIGAKLLGMSKLRELQLYPRRQFSFKSKVNLHAALMQTRGTLLEGEERCKRCIGGLGIFPHCVVVEGVSKGACGCCTYSCQAGACSLRKDLPNKAPDPGPVPVPTASRAPTAPATWKPSIVKPNAEIQKTFGVIGSRLSLRVNSRTHREATASARSIPLTTPAPEKKVSTATYRTAGARAISRPAAAFSSGSRSVVAKGKEGANISNDIQRTYMMVDSAIKDFKKQYERKMNEIDESFATLGRLINEQRRN